ncbi:MAG: ABC transporter substrate-binding protein [Gemmatimonadetes bacterium]|nr:ABC transporter substrate-binding protein [Gemmatimonadota bacterium]
MVRPVRAPITGITAVWMFFLFFGCSAPDHDGPSYGGRVRIGATGGTGGMEPINPVIASHTVSTEVLDLLFERLFAESPDGQLAPALAVAWPFSPRMKFWDILLRSDAQFHDGRPVTAEDVVFTLQLMRKQQNGENLLFERVEALSDDIVRLHYAEPLSQSSLLHLRLHILPKHLVGPQLAAGYGLGYNVLDPDITVSEWHSEDVRNWSGYVNAEVDQLIEAGRASHLPEERIAIYRRIHRHLLSDYPKIFICREPVLHAVRQPLRGMESIMRMGVFRSLPDWYWDRVP